MGEPIRMKKIALVYRRNPSDWTSCRSITRNLAEAYAMAFPKAELRPVFYEAHANSFAGHKAARQIVEFAPELLAFIDHSPFPGGLLKALRQESCRPRVVIHVFGDFMLHSCDWLGCEEVLKELNCSFVCASEKQRKLIGSLVAGGPATVSVMPFPVSVKDFYPSSLEARSSFRARAGLSSGNSVFLYTGRLSLQKNVVLLIKSFGAYVKQIDPGGQLWLAGPVDDLGIPYLGRRCLSGTYASDLLEVIEKTGLKQQVRYFGDLPVSALRELYGASDFFVSLSTHNDEDFGMAPAEAACAGLPLLLTDWGGYSSFKALNHESCAGVWVPVKLEEKRVTASFQSCVQARNRAIRF